MSIKLKSNKHQLNIGEDASLRVGVYEFDDFRLDVEHMMLYRNDEEVSLTPKQVETLLALIEKKGEIVSKESLMNRLWGDVVVDESNLTQNVYILRKSIGQATSGKPLIETLRRRGYRFNGKLKSYHHSPPSSVTGLRPGNAPVAKLVSEVVSVWRKPQIFALILIVITAAAAGGYYLLETPSAAVDDTKTFAVLPLKPIDIANRDGLYEIGIADALINQLNSAKGVVVRPLNATRKYTEIDQDPLAAGRDQQVDYVLASSYQLADRKILISTKLLNVKTGQVEESYQTEKDSSNLFAMQSAVASDIGNKILVRFGAVPADFESKRGTGNQEAYELYLLAINLSEERGVQNVLKSLEYLERAVALDPNYALAWADKALIHGDIVAHTDSGQHEHYQSSMEAIRKALSIDPTLSVAYSALCHNKNRYEYDFAGAETACKRAVELDPNSAVARKTYANFLYTRGRFDDSIVEIKKAIDLQPVSYRNQQIYALALYYARRYGEAEAQFKRLVELNPNHSFIHGRLIRVLDEQGKESEAYKYFIEMLTLRKTENRKIERFKAAYRTNGWRGVLIERIKTAEADPNFGSFELACLYAKTGDKNKALDFLEKAYTERSYLNAVLQVEPQLSSLRDDPRFVDLVRRIEGK